MAEPIKNVTLGGLTYNANLAKGREVEKGKFEIVFNSGEKLTYPQQPERFQYFDEYGRKIPEDRVASLPEEVRTAPPGENLWGGISKKVMQPKITQSIDACLVYDNTYFDISDVMGATFTSHKDTVSDVNLNNCKDTTVNLAANDSRWYGDSATINGGEGNEVILDKKDSAEINGKLVEGRGTASQKDYQ